jgi:4-amino-4-deoxy-L-arabinose transferase-like glycosyltransferase
VGPTVRTRQELLAQRAFRVFVLALFVALTVPRMTQKSMFIDGLLYAVVARNMSVGVGTFWSPTYTPTLAPEWFEHPPLAIGLQALMFRLLGDHLFVERVYSILVFALTGLLIAAIWRRLHPPGYEWLPLFLWVLPSTVTWAVINNMLEGTQTLFTTAAVLFVIIAARATAAGAAGAWACAAGLASVCAMLAKGPVGAFPLAAPALLLLLPDRPRVGRLLFVTGVMAGVVACCALAVVASDAARHSVSEYLRTQLFPSLQGLRETNADPLSAFKHLVMGVVMRMLVIGAVCRAVGRPGEAGSIRTSPAWALLAVGLAASLPVAVSPKMAGNYFLPSIPLFALGCASLMLGSVQSIVAKTARPARGVLLFLAGGLLAASVVVPIAYGPIEPRDTELMRNFDVVGAVMPRAVTIGTCKELDGDWGLHTYASRFFRVSLDPRGIPVNGWFLTSDDACRAPPACSRAAAGTRLALYRCEPGGSAAPAPREGETR